MTRSILGPRGSDLAAINEINRLQLSDSETPRLDYSAGPTERGESVWNYTSFLEPGEMTPRCSVCDEPQHRLIWSITFRHDGLCQRYPGRGRRYNWSHGVEVNIPPCHGVRSGVRIPLGPPNENPPIPYSCRCSVTGIPSTLRASLRSQAGRLDRPAPQCKMTL